MPGERTLEHASTEWNRRGPRRGMPGGGMSTGVGALAAVAAGSALGGVARYLAAVALASQSREFPVATLAVNIAGAFLLGLIVRALGDSQAVGARLFLAVGFCGGFTTFSTFSLDLIRLLQAGAAGRAAGYAVASVALSLGAVWLGLLAGRLLPIHR